MNGNLTITDGVLDVTTNDVNVNVAGDMTIGSAGSVDVSSYTGAWTFDGTTTYTDNHAAGSAVDMGDIVVSGTLTLGAGSGGDELKVNSINFTGASIDLGDTGATLIVTQDGGNNFTYDGTSTWDAGTNSKVLYLTDDDTDTTIETFSGVTLVIAGTHYHDLELDEPDGASVVYSADGNLKAAGSMTITDGTFDQTTRTVNVGNGLTIGASGAYVKADNNEALTFDGAGSITDSAGSQDLGNITIAATVDLESDITAEGIVVSDGAALETDGYDLDIGTAGMTLAGTLDNTDDEEGDKTQINIEGAWNAAGVDGITADEYTVVFDAGSGSVNVTSAGAGFYNFTIHDGGGAGETVVLQDTASVSNALTITDGILDVNDQDIGVGGNLSIASAGGVTKGSGTWTFNGIGSSSWSDSAGVKQDLGIVVIDGTSKTITTSTEVKAETLTIGADDVLDITDDTLTLSGSGTVLTNNNTFTATNSTVSYSPETASATEVGNVTYHHLSFDDTGSGGSVTFGPAGAVLDVNGNLTVTSGTLAMTTQSLDLEGDLSIAAAGALSFTSGSMNFAGSSFSVTGAYSKGASTLTFDRDHASGTITVDVNGAGTPGTLSLYHFEYDASGNANAATISIDDADTIEVENSVTLKGASDVNRLTLTSDDGTNTVDFDLQAGGTQDLDYLTAVRIDSASGLQMIPANTLAGSCTDTVNWACGTGGAYIWDGAVSSVWSASGNWDVGRSPAGDTSAVVTITDGVNPAVADAAIEVADLTINGGTNGKLSMAGNSLTVNGTFLAGGTLGLHGDEASISTPALSDGSTVE